ncbi:hypothetical protein QBA54_32150 [Streptomyces sp. B21-108]|uniref:hypothetical protein n=1 Tax=Streptomyces sp. B21-108 TaxID=3039419 RepID=UPI002FF34A69
MNKAIKVGAVIGLLAALVVAGCDWRGDDDCDARGLGIELTAVHTGKGGGSRSSGSRSSNRGSSSGKSTSPSGTSRHQGASHGSTVHGHHDDDWFDCDDD